MTATTLDVSYREHAGGIVLDVDEVIQDEDGLRLHVSITNTGERGTLNLVLNASRAMAVEASKADEWIKTYSRSRARAGMDATFQSFLETMFSLDAGEGAGLPQQLEPGSSWQGWLRSSRQPVTPETKGLFVILAPYYEGIDKRPKIFLAADATRPFISLRGEVTIQPIRGFELFAIRVTNFFRAQVIASRNLETLGTIVGAAFGGFAARVAGLDLSAAVLLVLGGIVLGGFLASMYKQYFRR